VVRIGDFNSDLGQLSFRATSRPQPHYLCAHGTPFDVRCSRTWEVRPNKVLAMRPFGRHEVSPPSGPLHASDKYSGSGSREGTAIFQAKRFALISRWLPLSGRKFRLGLAEQEYLWGTKGPKMADQPGQTTEIQDCLARLQAGDDAARAALVEHACRSLQQLAHRMLRGYPIVGRWEQTDDVLNQAMLRLHRALGEVCPGSPKEFLMLATTQVRRELIDMARHYGGPEGLGRHHATDGLRTDSGAPPRYEQADETHEPSSIAEWAEFHEKVEALPEVERQVFSLRWYDGLSFPEIGQMLGFTDRTAKRRWRDACLLLHAAMRAGSPGQGD